MVILLSDFILTVLVIFKLVVRLLKLLDDY